MMDSAAERLQRYRQHQLDAAKQELTENADLITAFQASCANQDIVLCDENFAYVQTIGIVATAPNLVGRLCPELVQDKDGLLDFTFLTGRYERHPVGSGLLCAENFLLLAHPYFRRGYHEQANFAPRFVELFWRLGDPQLTPAIALDFNRVRLNLDSRMYLESDTWYGAAFNEDIAAISDGTVKLRPPGYLNEFEINFFFADAYALDVKWTTEGHIKTFQAEEFKTLNVRVTLGGIEYLPVRYIHAEFNLKENRLQHFDGAIHFYSCDEYCERIDSDFNYNAKNRFQIKADSLKLFRINGSISIKTWVEFTSHFFAGNPLVLEYFEGKYPNYLLDVLAKLSLRTA